MNRVAYVCADDGCRPFGRKGSSVHVQDVIRALRRRGCRVELFAGVLGGEAPSDLRDLPVHLAPSCVNAGAVSDGQPPADGWYRQALEQAGAFDMVYERYALWNAAGMEHACATGARGVLEVNAPLIEEAATHRGLLDRAGAERMTRRVFDAASAIIAVSTEVATHLAPFAEAHGKVHVVPNGIDPTRFPAALALSREQTPRLPTEPFVVGFVGSLKPWHGVSLLIEAMVVLRARIPGARLLIVGDGPERAACERLVDERGLRQAAFFTGAVDPVDVPRYLAGMDVAVAPYPPSGHFYFSPLKVLEYMAAGCAVVATGIGQIAELIEHGRTGLLCEPDDPAALAGALGALHARPALRELLGSAARDSVLANHTWDQVVERVLSIAAGAGARGPQAAAAGAVS